METAEPLQDWFEQVWVINLKRRPERLARFWTEIEKAHWPFHRPRVFEAIDGSKVGVPKFWRSGSGGYGCLRSHLSILERAIMDDVETLLVLEDDAVFLKTFKQEVAEFLAKVPTDWQCLMLGGQHVNSQPAPVGPGVVRMDRKSDVRRTHCYALRGAEVMKALYRTWANTAVHCDWVMGPCLNKFNTYAPDPFLVGQAEGFSDIARRQNPARFWRPPNGTEPVVVLHAPREVMETLRQKGFHGGYSRDPLTGIDVGLRDLFAEKSMPDIERDKRLRKWLERIQWEVASLADPAVCTVWHPETSGAMIQPLVEGPVLDITAATVEAALNQLPAGILAPQRDFIPVVLLRSSREVMAALRNRGWHTGRQCDRLTGINVGVQNLFASTESFLERSIELRRVAETLHEEAAQMPGGIATLWHDEISSKMLNAGEFEVIEICAATPEEALAKLNAVTNEVDDRAAS